MTSATGVLVDVLFDESELFFPDTHELIIGISNAAAMNRFFLGHVSEEVTSLLCYKNRLYMKITKLLIGFLTATVILVSCSSNNSSSGADANLATTTTIPVVALNPSTELDLLAKRVTAVDYSRLSINHEGIFAVILRDKRAGDVYTVGTFTLWRWDGKIWNDVSGSIKDRPLDIEFFEPGSSYGGTKVTSYDYNEDGVIDFLLEFDEKDRGINHSPGAILSSRGGNWHWESLMTLDGTISQAAMSWFYWPDSRRLSIRDFPPDSMATDVTVNWDAERKMFVAQSEYVYGD